MGVYARVSLNIFGKIYTLYGDMSLISYLQDTLYTGYVSVDNFFILSTINCFVLLIFD